MFHEWSRFNYIWSFQFVKAYCNHVISYVLSEEVNQLNQHVIIKPNVLDVLLLQKQEHL